MSNDSKESQLLKRYFSIFDIPADFRIQSLRAWEKGSIYGSLNQKIIRLE